MNPGSTEDPKQQRNNGNLTRQPSKTQMSIKDIVAAANQRGDTNSDIRSDPRDPLEQYTKGEMPQVHLAHPTAALSDIELDTIGEWEALPGSKLLAQAFGGYAANPKTHGTLWTLIFGAVLDITKSNTAAVCAPQQSQTSTKTPISFLIYKLTETQKQMLLHRRVWSSTMITFRVLPIEPACPDFLFQIKDLTTLATQEVYQAIHEVWHDETTGAFLDTICNEIPDESRDEAERTLLSFINSMWTTILDTRHRGNIPAPTFCIYASGDIIGDNETWCRLRNYFTAREYKIKFQDPGNNKIPQRTCSICQGVDHPRGLCPFPAVKNWNGPTRNEDPSLEEPERRGRESMTFRDRNKSKTGRIF